MNSTSLDITTAHPDMLTFTVPLTAAYHQIAENFYQQHSDQTKAKQVYLNTLSVQAVNFYLTCLGIKTSLERSQSWNMALQVLVDTADLWVNGLGQLECRPLLPNTEMCFVPAQVWSDRIGYVVVQFNAELTEATLLGFVSHVEAECLLLEQLQSLEQLPEYLNTLAATSTQLSPSPATLTVLSRWLYHEMEAGWNTVEQLMDDLQTQYAFSFRSPVTTSQPEAATGVRRGKLLQLKDEPEVQVLLLVEIIPGTALEYQMKVEVYPVGEETYLPRSLHVAVMDETGKSVLQAENSNSEGLEFHFIGEVGEKFSVSVSLNQCNIVEEFEV